MSHGNSYVKPSLLTWYSGSGIHSLRLTQPIKLSNIERNRRKYPTKFRFTLRKRKEQISDNRSEFLSFETRNHHAEPR